MDFSFARILLGSYPVCCTQLCRPYFQRFIPTVVTSDKVL